MPRVTTSAETTCVHCGDPCRADSPRLGEMSFCCAGCRTVYQLLHAHDLQTYYDLSDTPGVRPDDTRPDDHYAFLDDTSIRDRLIAYSDGSLSRVTFSIPQMHCSSCIWLLENLPSLEPNVAEARVDFLRREVTIRFREQDLSLRHLAELLGRLGYQPDIKLANLDRAPVDRSVRHVYARLAVAGFCAGNVMLLSFPEYLGLDGSVESHFARLFSYLSLALSLPVLLYSASEFFRSAWVGLRHRVMNIDVPIAIGISVLFLRSAVDITLLGQEGYLDSFCAFVFLLLIGRWFQGRTYASVSFDRDYRAYFPVAVLRKQDDTTVSTLIESLKPGDRILIRNNELIPADAVLISGHGRIDYSFVTGESAPVNAVSGDRIYAGGRQLGATLELEVVKEVASSYLTRLWKKLKTDVASESTFISLTNRLSRYFTPTVLSIAAATAIYWILFDPTLALSAATAVLIVACPCALALAAPFTLGTVHRIFERNGFLIKEAGSVERLAAVKRIVFDKTGTITTAHTPHPEFVGDHLSSEDIVLIQSVIRHSTHPLAVALASEVDAIVLKPVEQYEEATGRGVAARVAEHVVRLGSATWAGARLPDHERETTRVYVAIDGQVRGYYRFGQHYRDGSEELLAVLGREHRLALLSGDTDAEIDRVRAMFGPDADLYFRQSPHDKLAYVRAKRVDGDELLMVGDGLNDAGALRAASVGIAVVENNTAFFPACDGILDGARLIDLPRFLQLARRSLGIIRASFVLSFLYNLIGLVLAVQGVLSPLAAAVLMPLSSISVVLFTSVAVIYRARQLELGVPWK